MAGRYKVYKHTSPSGKVYIGITCQAVEKRWLNGKGYSHSTYFYQAIQKYGWDSFEHEVLYTGLTKEEAEAKEIELIKEYKSNQKEYGYNLSSGGECGAVGVKRSEETKKKMSESKKGKKLPEDVRQERLLARNAKLANGGKACALQEILEHLDDIERWSGEGATEEQIAKNFGITRQTFSKYKKNNISIFNAIKKGRTNLVDELKGALAQKAMGFEYKEQKIIEERDKETGELIVVRRETYIKKALPDVASINLLLKNYDTDNWANEPQLLALKREELEFHKEKLKKSEW